MGWFGMPLQKGGQSNIFRVRAYFYIYTLHYILLHLENSSSKGAQSVFTILYRLNYVQQCLKNSIVNTGQGFGYGPGPKWSHLFKWGYGLVPGGVRIASVLG